MSSSLVIVESPAKCKTLERYLGKDFKVLASYGHVRDLLPKTGAVDPENNFSMRYEAIEKNAKAVDAISKALKKADTLYLATDPDREGEAISWHLHELLKEKGYLKDKTVRRVVFHEVTKSAIQEAIKHPRELAANLIDAQQARRALDYLVGFNLSPLLWKKIQRGLSAGRVQSPALRMIAEREKEIQAFKPREYWTIEADLEHKQSQFRGKLIQYDNEKIKQFSIEKSTHAADVKASLEKAAAGELLVEKVTKKQRKRQPAAPFITSTLQQEAIRKLGFTAQRAMRTAQQLYEGIDVGEGAVGLITYMRTDSVNLAQEAVDEMRTFIASRYGKNALPSEPRVFKTKSKNAQEAHEAIRPTSVTRVPQEIKSSLTTEQFKLYELIWKRAMASQMKHATIDTVAVDMSCGKGNLFRANGSAIADAGFMEVYLEGKDDSKEGDEDEKMLPQIEEGEKIKLREIRDEQHFTEPPPRFSEASLVKTLEEYGIGRPSTYANIISTLRNREYVEIENKRFHPTDVGKIVNDFLTNHFTDYVDYEFTANLEDELDAISRGEKEWLPLMQNFWVPFSKQVKNIEENVSRSEVAQARVLGVHPKSGKEISVRIGRYGPYAQIGTKDDEDKPKFAGLRPGQKLDTITLEEALELFKLPRLLGETDEGEEIAASVGRFGPYIRYGSKFASMTKDDDPYTVTLERALELVAEKKKADAEKQIKVFEGEGISILNGRYGPYITDGTKNAKIPKDREPASLSLEESVALLEAAPVSRGRGRKKAATKKAATKKKTTSKKKVSKKTATKKVASKTS
jgi:DNA topoisomerase-1